MAHHPKRVAVIRFSSVGDIVLTTPALHALKRARPECEIVFVTKAAMRPLIAHSPHVDALVFPAAEESASALGARVRELDVDGVIDLHGNHRSRRVRAALRQRTVVWEKRPWQDNLPVRLGLRPYRARMMIAERYHRAVERFLDEDVEAGELRYVVGADDQSQADDILTANNIERGETLVGFSPGAMWETKRWPLERFAELAKRVVRSGWRVVLTGSPAEAPLLKKIVEHVPEAVSLAGAMKLGALGGVIARCAAFVANDSGPMHIARGLGVPTLAFFGTTAPAQFDFTNHALMYANIGCSPCHFYGRRRCPRGHFRCMLELSVDEAWSALAPRVGAGPVPLVHG
ncbi:MAG: glycosyltransferase family 9 protein [Myxococcota bacterium]